MGKNLTEEELRELPANKPIKLDNVTCVYCSTELSKVKNNKEHVIARRFVPKGKLENQWNLIVRTCEVCNNKKSDLEDDISAISMQPDLHGSHVVDDESLVTDSIRRSKSFSRRTSKRVLDSKEELTLKAPFFGGSITFNLTSPPQIDPDRTFELARFHLTAFFYWLSYNEISKRGGYWIGIYFPIQATSKRDWGNSVNKEFMRLVIDWELRLKTEPADGYFKVIIRKNPESACWSWALEWNKNYRVIGLFGNKEAIENFNSLLGAPKVKVINNCTYKEEMPLSDEDDSLFKLSI